MGPEAAAAIGLQQQLTPLPIPFGRIAGATQTAAMKTRKRVKSKFNKAVSAGMKAVRMSTSYGGKNKLAMLRRHLPRVTKTASKIKKVLR